MYVFPFTSLITPRVQMESWCGKSTHAMTHHPLVFPILSKEISDLDLLDLVLFKCFSSVSTYMCSIWWQML